MEQFIKKLINSSSYETISKVIPQKGEFVEIGNRVLIGCVNKDNKQYQMFVDGNATLYYTDSQIPPTIALQDLHFFIPNIQDYGVKDVYEIIKIRTICSEDLNSSKELDEENSILRLAFELRYVEKRDRSYRYIDESKLLNHTFIDTTFDKLDECIAADYVSELMLYS